MNGKQEVDEPREEVGIALVGPVRPYRGGIAQHTEMLLAALEEAGGEVICVSFSRQYPTLLFPGKSDRDPQKRRLEAANVRYLIDSLNPLTWRRAAVEIARFGADIVVLPWWTWYWAPCFGYLARALSRRGVDVRFVCHNVVDHETAGWKARLSRWALLGGDSFVVQSRHEADRLSRLVGARSLRTHPHPVYSQFPAARTSLPRRAAQELLFYGFVRPYKGLDVLIEALARCCSQDIALTVAGEFWQGEARARARIAELGLGDLVEIAPRYHSELETAALFDRADVVVMPYLSATGSGVLGLALHYGRPVIASAVGGLADIVEDGVTGLLVSPGDADALARAIDDMPAERSAAMRDAVRARARSLTWASLARCVLAQ